MWILRIGLIAITGIFIGWLCTKIISQFPKRQHIFHSTKCNNCDTPIKPFQQLPIIGYFLSHGKCSTCGRKYRSFVIIVPFITPLLLILLFVKFHFSLLFFQYSLLTIAGILIFFLDINDRIIPDIITLPMILVALIFSFFNDLGFWATLRGGAFCAGIFLLIAIIFRLITKREGLGGGDIKLICMIGFSLGFKLTFLTIFLSSVIGMIIYAFSKFRRTMLIPFGSFIVIAMFVSIMTGNELINWYLGIWGI